MIKETKTVTTNQKQEEPESNICRSRIYKIYREEVTKYKQQINKSKRLLNAPAHEQKVSRNIK